MTNADPPTTPRNPRPRRLTARVAVAVVSVGAAYLALLKSTTPSQEGDFFDGPWFWWGWLVLPAIAAGAAWIDAKGSAYWGWLVVAPQAVATVVEGTLLHDPNQGASFWPVGLIFVGLLGCLASGAASLGAAARTRGALVPLVVPLDEWAGRPRPLPIAQTEKTRRSPAGPNGEGQ